MTSGAMTSGEPPQRIVSINQCADELLLNLASRAQIKSVSHYVKDPAISWDADLALGIPGNQGAVEEILQYDPDLVLVGEFNARTTVNMLRALGLNVVEVSHPKRVDEAFKLIRQVARWVGHEGRAAPLIRPLQVALQRSYSGKPVTAVVYQPNGFTTGRNSVIDDVMRAAGLKNVAAEWGSGEYSYFPMERLLWQQPQLLILDPQTEDTPSLAHQVLEHPALAVQFGRAQTVTIPAQAWACGSHHLLRAIELLQRAAAPLRNAS